MSLRARLIAAVAVVALVLVAVAALVTRATESYLVDQVDDQLRAAGQPVRELGRGPGPDGGPEHGPPTDLYTARVEPDGTLLVTSTPNLTGADPPPNITVEQVLAAADAGEPFTVDDPATGVRYRAIATRDSRDGDVVVAALSLSGVDGAVGRLVRAELIATAIVLAILGLATWWVIRLGLRPLKQMTRTATAIAEGELSHRVPAVAEGTEAGELGVALNRMLGRIEEAFDERSRSEERLRQFVADASHELRTPVTTIRGYAELYRAGGLDDGDELTQAMRRTEQEAVRMGLLVEDMLVLARLDQGRPLDRSVVDLGDLAADAVSDARAVQPDRPLAADAAEGVTVMGDESGLRQVVANLVGNALVHTPAGTPVEVRARREGTWAVLEVADRGPGMDDEIAAKAFERFYRADPARSRHRGGSGLGLAIVKAMVEAHGGRVALATAAGQGTTVRVDLPAAL